MSGYGNKSGRHFRASRLNLLKNHFKYNKKNKPRQKAGPAH